MECHRHQLAFAHMVAFETDLKGFAHLHPLEYEPPKSGDDARSGPLTFSFNTKYKILLPVRVSANKTVLLLSHSSFVAYLYLITKYAIFKC